MGESPKGISLLIVKKNSKGFVLSKTAGVCGVVLPFGFTEPQI